MQFLLTKEEYDKLCSEAKRGREILDDENLQKLCTAVAQKMPVAVPWRKPQPDKPWGCIITKETEYCDECPVSGICPNKYKQWSK